MSARTAEDTINSMEALLLGAEEDLHRAKLALVAAKLAQLKELQRDKELSV